MITVTIEIKEWGLWLLAGWAVLSIIIQIVNTIDRHVQNRILEYELKHPKK